MIEALRRPDRGRDVRWVRAGVVAALGVGAWLGSASAQLPVMPTFVPQPIPEPSVWREANQSAVRQAGSAPQVVYSSEPVQPVNVGPNPPGSPVMPSAPLVIQQVQAAVPVPMSPTPAVPVMPPSFPVTMPSGAATPAMPPAMPEPGPPTVTVVNPSATVANIFPPINLGATTVLCDPSGCPAAPAEPPAMSSKWRHGVFTESKDKSFTAHVGGVVQYDGAWYNAQPGVESAPNGPGDFQDAVSPRRLRLRMEGNLAKTIEYFFEMEFFNGFNATVTNAPTNANTFLTPGPTDAWITLTDVPIVGNIRIGNQKEPFSLERLNSARFLEFLERSYLFDLNPVSSFNNNRSPGILLFRNLAEGRVYTGIGFFKATQDPYGYGVGDGEYAVTGRLTGLPIYNPEGQYYWHVGGAMSHRDPPNGQTRVRVRDLIRSGPGPFLNVVADTGLLGASSQDLFDIETAAVYGPVTLQAEYEVNVIRGTRVNGTGPDIGATVFQGWYGEVLYFLTGESRKWRTGPANFDRVVPRNPLSYEHGRLTGTGAWELGARYSFLDLNDKTIGGGRLNGVTLGVNWYWTGNAKAQFNYDYMFKDGAASPSNGGIVHSFGSRIAYDF
jgi:phosphate-selective porin OprO and OprP